MASGQSILFAFKQPTANLRQHVFLLLEHTFLSFGQMPLRFRQVPPVILPCREVERARLVEGTRLCAHASTVFKKRIGNLLVEGVGMVYPAPSRRQLLLRYFGSPFRWRR
jgi:hypothetical protein